VALLDGRRTRAEVTELLEARHGGEDVAAKVERCVDLLAQWGLLANG